MRLLRLENSDKIKKKKYDPNTVGLEDSSEESSDIETDRESDGHIQESEDIPTESIIEETLQNSTDSNIKNDEEKADDTLKSKESSTKAKDSKIEDKTKDMKLKKVLTHETVHIEVKRDPKVQVARLKLPILGEEQRIMELINENEFLIIAGETGNYILLLPNCTQDMSLTDFIWLSLILA